MPNFKALAPSKVNLCLFVLFKRNDGYHEIESVMQTINIFDEITIEPTPENIKLLVEPPLDVSLEENLAFKAAKNFFEATAIEGGASIKLKKNIPPGSGLGGGSSDAAAVLLLLNRAYGSPLTFKELENLGEILGSDVPFFLVQGTALVKGRGEKVYPLPFNLTFHLTVVMPSKSLSTAFVYENLTPGKSLEKNTLQVLKALRERDLGLLGRSLRNDLEAVAGRFVPEVWTIRDLLLQAGALGAVVSGSGSAVFGLFPDSKQAEKATNFFQSHGFWARHAWGTPPLR
ncbi:MAG: 4-(cytidine 5'-diphospho)-2-C-methyl-D-erythritol kinase [Caldiserica bacterium]|jgi:4-diphosphocytidyl-2-C-methyl-D-erythritol kinase|nr:4-(cytidine 5'-diphospho)-2-C-methyl-D-erythritol kinase [Caldisericota bacterium]MDH7562918.1 4-(cytidine 5'-diphospho)-2-C-methyl-D-erythritol kinase [Caldisericota bacterium]